MYKEQGEKFMVGNIQLQVVVSDDCSGCYLTGKDCVGHICDSTRRDDGTEVIFVEVDKKDREWILCAAIKATNDLIIPGHRHSDCYKLLGDVGYSCYIPGREGQGFLTSKNRFVSRKEAWKIAKENNQIMWGLEASENDEDLILISENLY